MTKKKKEKRRKRDKIKMIKINKKMTMKRRSSPLSNPKEAEVLCIMKSYLPHEDRWLVHSMHSLNVTSLHRQSLTVYTVQSMYSLYQSEDDCGDLEATAMPPGGRI